MDFTLDGFAGRATGYDACRSGISIDGLSSARESVSACVLDAADCEAAVACAFVEPAGTCGEPSTVCDGDLLRGCFAGAAVARDCAAEGLSCLDNGNLACGTEAPCTASRCEGDRLFTCVFSGEREIATDCGPGLCRVDAETGRGVCLPSFETCDLGSDHCDGDVAVGCYEGYARRTLCAPGQCRETDGAFCASPEPCVSTCDGESLSACVAGTRREAVDCTQWGSPGCIEEDGGARCAP